MSRIEVSKGETIGKKEGKFRVLVNWVQHGVELSCAEAADKHALSLCAIYPNSTLILWGKNPAK